MVDTRRKIITVPEESADLDYCTLKEARARIDALISEYSETAKLDFHTPEYNDNRYLYVFKERFETDKELAIRLEREEEHARAREEYDRREFERLTAKFKT